MTFGERIKQARELADLSVYRVSKLSGVDGAFIHAIERGDKSPSLAIAQKLCQVLKIGLAEFDLPHEKVDP